jgi:hypothetical protein
MILDFDLDFLRDAAALVDVRLERLDEEATASHDPDAFGVFDQAEYITGFGFVACQTYTTAIMSSCKLKLKKHEALALAHVWGEVAESAGFRARKCLVL